MIPNVTHHHQNLTEMHIPHSKEINISAVICDHFTSSGYFCTNSGIACTIDTTTSTHEFHGAEKMKPGSLLPSAKVFITQPYPLQVKLRHYKGRG